MKELILKNKILSIVIGLLIVIGIIWLFSSNSKSDGSARSLAKCLKDNGTKFYGASWCPHCNSQKKMFGDDAKYLPYIECTENKQECSDAKVTGYPTWIFADGKRQSGEIPLVQLKQMAGC